MRKSLYALAAMLAMALASAGPPAYADPPASARASAQPIDKADHAAAIDSAAAAHQAQAEAYKPAHGGYPGQVPMRPNLRPVAGTPPADVPAERWRRAPADLDRLIDHARPANVRGFWIHKWREPAPPA